jgi:hypothetical protein
MPGVFRRNFILNKLLSLALQNSEDDLLIFCSFHEIIDDNCHFSDMFLIACKDVFRETTRLTSIKEIATKIVAVIEPDIDVTVLYIPAKYNFLKFLLNMTFVAFIICEI